MLESTFMLSWNTQHEQTHLHLNVLFLTFRSVNVNPSWPRNVLYELDNVSGVEVHRSDGMIFREEVVELLPGHCDVRPAKSVHLHPPPA